MIGAFAVPPAHLAICAQTIWAEARGEGIGGMIAVAWVIRNRVEADLKGDGRPDWWGEGYEAVCRKPFQFSCWLPTDPNYPLMLKLSLALPTGRLPDPTFLMAFGVMCGVISGLIPDPTEGATHYFNPQIARPSWAKAFHATRVIGRHVFLHDPEAVLPQRTVPVVGSEGNGPLKA